MPRPTPLLLILLCGVVSPSPAHASQVFPQVVRQEWGIQDLGVPGDGCRLCHTNDNGNADTVRQKFGVALRDEFGVRGGNTPALKAALARVRSDRWDSDGDSVPDYEELAAGTDLNVKDAPPPPPEPAAGAGGAGAGGEEPLGGEHGETPEPSSPPELELPTLETGCAVMPAQSGSNEAPFGVLLLAVIALRRRHELQR
ncbi:MAG TPA: thrombospondin type 3 repeat-containing protein [Polyangiaceae bacterium]